MQALNDWIKEIKNDPNISEWKEAQAREWIIRPILDLLGWGRREIIPEHGVETQSVDYALQINDENEVFIEAKRPRENLENHQKQILDYSFKEGVELAILTNGITWWFYLPLQKGPWNDRKFYTINILEHEIEDIVGKFGLLLSRKNVESGKATQHAESILKSRRRERLVRKNFAQLPPTKRTDIKPSRKTNNQTEKPKRMQIVNKNYALTYDYEIFVNTANWLIDKGALKPSDCPLKVNPKAKLNYISNKIENGYPQDWTKPQNGCYIYKNLQNLDNIKNAKRLLAYYGYDPAILQIDY